MSAHNTKVADVAEALDAGWRPDPTGRYEWRYWDGGWTNRVASSRPAMPDAVPAGPAPRPSPPAAAPPQPGPAPYVAPQAAPEPQSFAPPAPAPVPAAPPSAPVTESAADAAPIDVGWEPARPEAQVEPKTRTSRGAVVGRAAGAVTGFFKSFANEPESYHSNRSIEIERDPRGEMLVATPANYGRAGLVALAACGVATGSYLPWLSGTIDGIGFSQTGFEDGHGWAFTIGAFALVCAALLAVRLRPVRWIAVAIAVALVGLTFRDLVHVHDVVTTMNASPTTAADVGTGLWIMAGCSVVALIASFRLGERT